MAWNGRVVKTYGRHKRRMIKNEAWISPELKPSVTNVFSSPDTDVSASSMNGSIDATSCVPAGGRPTKHLGRGSNILTSSSPVVESNKENEAVTLAPETPEDEQCKRKRTTVRNARKITRNKQVESTPKLFSSDSEDGLRKAVGRKALSQKSNTMETNKITNGKQHIKSQVPAQPRRVKNIIENDTYTIIRSPPPRCQKASKRFKSTKPARQISDGDSNFPMSPFEMIESWIDVVAATSTPMVELVKLDSNDKRIKGNNLLEDSLGNHDQEQPCSKHRKCGRSCKCKTCEDTDRVASKLFELTLSGEEEEVNGESRNTHETLEQKTLPETRLRRRKIVNYKEDSLEDIKLKGKRKPKSQAQWAENKNEDSNSSSSSSFLESCSSPSSSRGLSSANADSSGDAGSGDSKSSMSVCSVSIEPLSRELQNLHLKSTACENEVARRTRLRTRGQSQEEDSDEELVLNARKVRTTHGKGKGNSVEKGDNKNDVLSSRIRTRGQSRTETTKTGHEEEEYELPLRQTRTRAQSRRRESDDEDEKKERKGSGARGLRVRGQRQSRQEEEENDKECKVKSKTRVLRTRGYSTSDASEDDHGIKQRIATKGHSTDGAAESDDDEKISRIHTRGQSTEEEEPLCPVTPKKKHMASFHTDSFKEVFTPKKHSDTGLPVTSQEKVLHQCEQTQPISFTECISPSMLNKCVKIGEGVYGEVFRAVNSKRQSVALKIIPIEGDFEVNEEPQKTFEEILPEIVISRELSFLSEGEVNYSNNFIGVNNVSCVQGCYPEVLLKEWDKFDDRKGSENDRPDIFEEEQLYIVFEFADGGQDLEGFEFDNLQQAVSILQQVACALAVAEKELEFEHRDLHWGNVLIRSTRQNHIGFRLGDEDYSVVSHGLEAGIIDFTLSRLQKDECTIFCDLAADPTLFEGTGDYQFQVYRKMKKENDNNWEPFMPHTNVLWLHYLTDKIMNSKTYQNSNSKAHKSTLSNLRSFYRHLLSHSSAEEVVTESDLFHL